MTKNIASIPRVQIAGIKSIFEAEMSIQSGADGLGLLQMLDYVRGDAITQGAAAEIIAWAKGKAISVMITHSTDIDVVADWAKTINVDTVQVHNDSEENEMPIAQLQKLRALLPKTGIIKSLHIPRQLGDEASYQNLKAQAQELGAVADALILDTKAIQVIEGEETMTLGGTGVKHDWAVSQRLIAECPQVKFIMAGGLDPHNVAQAIEALKPFAVDVNSGTCKDGSVEKDPARLKAFCENANAALARLTPTHP